MSEEWRTFLYPFGFVSAFAFGARFIVQWLQSEKAHKSIVPASFWILSLIGNISLLIHSFVQIQFAVSLIQSCNAVISWRNLNLMQKKRPPASFRKVCYLIAGAIFLTLASFAIQDRLLLHDGGWMRVPTAPWQQPSARSISSFWHILGAFAYLLFSSRFWIQWWYAEKEMNSTLPLSFWWLSIFGALLSIVYFVRIGDSVNLIGPLTGLIPYLRNLMLLRSEKTAPQNL